MTIRTGCSVAALLLLVCGMVPAAGLAAAPAASADPATADAAGLEGAPASLSVRDVQQLMASRGWIVVRDLAGNLLLFQQPSAAVTVGDTLAQPEKQTPVEADRGTAATPAGRVISLEEAQRVLAGYGWRAERRSDGGIDLAPVSLSAALPADSGRAAVGTAGAPAAGVSERPAAARYASLAEVQGLVEERGWRLVSDAAGNVVLRPLLPPAASDEPSAEADVTKCCGWSPDTAAIAELSLPVDRESEARLLAEGWLRASGAAGERVGAVRRINSVYVVSLVAAPPSQRLTNQLAIRRHDGCVYALLGPGRR